MRLLLKLVVVVGIAAAGCSAPSNPCERVRCNPGFECDPIDGRCLRVDDDGGSAGGGAGGGNATGGGSGGGGGTGGGEACSPACTGTSKCEVSTGRCVECLANTDCSCPRPLCVMGSCLAPVVDADAGPVVISPTPSESCATAAQNAFTFFGCTTPRTFTFRVNINGHTDDEEGVCSVPSSGGPDLVYVLSLEAAYDLRVSVNPVSGSFAEPLVYLRRLPCDGQELACTDSGGMGFGATVSARNRPAGQYAIFVDSYDSGGGGEVDVTVTLSAPTLPGNDTCLAADPIPTDGGTTRVDLSIAHNDENLFCNRFGLNSLDVAYRFDLPAPGNIVARATAVDPDAGVSPVIEVRTSCNTSDLVACSGANMAGNAGVFVRGAPAGTYWLLVESWDSGVAGPVDVSVTVLPPSPPLLNDTCSAARDIAFPPDGGTTTEFDVDTSTANDDYDGTCNDPADPVFPGPGGPEYVYRLRLLAPRYVSISAAPGPSSATDPVLYIRQGVCTNKQTEVACDDDVNYPDDLGSQFVSSGPLPAGDYFIFIEGRGVDFGPTHVTVSATP